MILGCLILKRRSFYLCGLSMLFLAISSPKAKTLAIQSPPLAATSSGGKQIERGAASTETEILRQVVLRPRVFGATTFPASRIDLGEIECGKKYVIRLRLKNETGEPIVFRRVGASCACVELRVKSGEIEKDESLDVEAVVSVPDKQTVDVFLVGIDFFIDETSRDPNPFFQIRAQSHKVLGLVCFGDVPSTLQVGQGLKQLNIPMIITDPVDPKDLEIEKSESLSDAIISIQTEGDRKELLMDISGVLLDEGFRDCWIKVRREPQSPAGMTTMRFGGYRVVKL